ncbi:MAG: 4Fe-4S binding protein [Anaerolineales bacterium]|nr:4Fe-4S binding protein [Anaerolineales bacterium]
MKIVTMLQDVWRSFWQRPVTRPYPAEKQPTPERLRGQLHYDPTRCTGCCLCMKECPANALELITLDQKAKRFVLRYDMDRCTFCAQCVQNCRFDCLDMSSAEWELAATNKEPFTIYYGDEEDVAAVLGKFPNTDSETAAS